MTTIKAPLTKPSFGCGCYPTFRPVELGWVVLKTVNSIASHEPCMGACALLAVGPWSPEHTEIGANTEHEFSSCWTATEARYIPVCKVYRADYRQNEVYH
jgi:hypothetical protein